MNARRVRLGAGLAGLLVTAIAIALLSLPAAASASVFSFTELQPAYTPPGGAPAASLVTGDFNRDGKVDIAFANGAGMDPPSCPSDGCVSVLLGKGNGTFTGPVDYPTGGLVSADTAALAVGDLNNDGNPDLVVANTSGGVSILYGNGDGTFRAPVDITDGVGDQPDDVAIGDFNGDGLQDIAVATDEGAVDVLLNQGNGTFTPAPGSPFALASDGEVDGMTVADLTGHGSVDLVLSIASEFGEGPCVASTYTCIDVLTDANDGKGDFDPVAAYPVDGAGQVAAADIRGSGVDDVLVPAETPAGSGFEILSNQGNGTLGPPALYSYPGAANPRGITVADFAPGDPPDVAVADFSSNLIAVFQGHGDGTFSYDDTVDDPFFFQESGNALVAADFTGDCKVDLAIASDETGVAVMRNDTPPAGSACPPPPPPPTHAPPTTTPAPPTTTPAPPATTTPPPTTTTPPPTTTPAKARPKRHRHHPVRHRSHKARHRSHKARHRSHKPRHRSHRPRRHHKVRHHHRPIRVTERIRIARDPLDACTSSSMPLRVTVSLSPRAVAARETRLGRPAVRLTTVVRLDGHRIRTSTRRTFTLVVPVNESTAGDALTITARSSGAHIRGTRDMRTVHLAACAPPTPKVTG